MNETLYDVIIVGAGHSGIEAALASSRQGCRVLVCTQSIETIGLMPCNPSIGGPAKGQIVGEIDALGGEMGKAADATLLQIRILNRSRGPAVQCLRTQNDKVDYKNHMKNKLLNDANIRVLECTVSGLIFDGDTVKGVLDSEEVPYYSKTVILTTGTFLKGKMHTGLISSPGGRLGEAHAEHLSDSLRQRFKIGRLKTGTPPRLKRESIDFSNMAPQPGDNEFLRFSFKTPYSEAYKNQIDCHLTHTNPKTHDIILNNLDRSPLFTKVIQGIGPRYCPSIEDKVVRFKDKDSHHIFIEPEGRNSNEMYPQGLNTSLPRDVQEAFLRSMKGLENVEIVKWGYAVEYDFFHPEQLKPTLETKPVRNLYFAGQINGTSGYEEAAGQGIVAGINAGRRALNKDPFILSREESFIGTMIDDLITKKIVEPYRMLTSRSEFRLSLRQDNAPFRLSERAFEAKLLSFNDISIVREKRKAVSSLIKTWSKSTTPQAFVDRYQLLHKIPISHLVKRPDVAVSDLISEKVVGDDLREIANLAIVEIKYEGYLKKQQTEINKINKLESMPLSSDLDYSKILGLKKESREKLDAYKPKTIYDAKRLPGVNPADISVLISFLGKKHAY